MAKISFRRLSQYGYEDDVFDKYREAITRSNRWSLKVLSIEALAVGALALLYCLITKEVQSAYLYCAFLILAGGLGLFIALRKEPESGGIRGKGREIVLALYLICVAAFALSIHATIHRNSVAFWVGTQLLLCCYVLDYAWRMAGLQVLSFLTLGVIWLGRGMETGNDTRALVSLGFLALGLVTGYVQGRNRLSLITSREDTRKERDTDLLTGLTMRVAAQQEIEEHLKSDEHGVMMLMDLDRFKLVNDQLGHQKGDQVLIDVAADLKRMFRNSDVLSRLGGDEFVVYMKSVPEKDWALQRAEQMVREVRRWIGDGTTNIQISASVGIVMTDMVNRTYDDLYRAADIAMYYAKSQGGNKALFYSPELLEEARRASEERGESWQAEGSSRGGRLAGLTRTPEELMHRGTIDPNDPAKKEKTEQS